MIAPGLRAALVDELAAHVARKRRTVLRVEGPAGCPVLLALDVLGAEVALGGLTDAERARVFAETGATS